MFFFLEAWLSTASGHLGTYNGQVRRLSGQHLLYLLSHLHPSR
jgi:hypothetical protein